MKFIIRKIYSKIEIYLIQHFSHMNFYPREISFHLLIVIYWSFFKFPYCYLIRTHVFENVRTRYFEKRKQRRNREMSKGSAGGIIANPLVLGIPMLFGWKSGSRGVVQESVKGVGGPRNSGEPPKWPWIGVCGRGW